MTITTPAQAAHAVLQLQDTGKPVYKVGKHLVDDNVGIRKTLIIFIKEFETQDKYVFFR